MATEGDVSLLRSSETFCDFSCSVCAKKNKQTHGKSYCVECNETFCIFCLVFHNKVANMRQHTLLDQHKMATRRLQQDVVELLKQDVVKLPKQDVVKLPKQDVVKLPKQDVVKLPKQDVIELHKQDVVKLPKQNVVKLPKQDVVELPKQDVVELPKQDVVELPKQDVVELPKQDVVESPKQDVVKLPKQDVVELPKQDVVKLPTSLCTVHQGQIISMYCGQDDLVCCPLCMAEDHRTCEGLSYISKKAKTIQTSQEMKDVNAAIDTMIKDIHILKKCQKLHLDRITEQNQQIQASIKEFRVQINQHLDEIEATTRAELERKLKIKEDEINDALAKLDDELSKLEETAHKLKNDQNESQLFVDMKEAKMKKKSDWKLIDDIETSVENSTMKFVPNNEILHMLEIKDLGTLKDQNTISSVSRHGDFNVKTLNDKNKCTITGACLMLDGNIVITDVRNEKLKLLDISYIVIGEKKLPGLPSDVCRTSPTEVAIALSNTKMVQFAKVTEKISLKTSFVVSDCCHSIAYNRGLLFVLCGGWKKGPGQLQVYDKVGQLQKAFSKDKQKIDLFTYPLAIVISECREKLHVARRNDGILTINLEGIKHSELMVADVKSHNRVCVVNKEDLIVSGYESSNVILADHNGQQKAILLGEKDGIVKPWSVLYDRINSRLIVSFYQCNLIKVFNAS